MEKIIINETEVSPKISFDPEKGFLDIIGSSYPENAMVIYNPLLKSLKGFVDSKPNSIHASFYLEYLSSLSSKMIMHIIKILDEAALNGCDVKVNWFYEEDDEDIMEFGEELQEGVDVKLNIQKYQL